MYHVLCATDRREGLGGVLESVHCAGCGHGIADPVLGHLAVWYPTTYPQHAEHGGLAARVAAAAVRHTACTRWGSGSIERLAPDSALKGPIAPVARVLSVTPGSGAFVRALHDVAVDAHGVEPGVNAVAAAHIAGCDTVV